VIRITARATDALTELSKVFQAFALVTAFSRALLFYKLLKNMSKTMEVNDGGLVIVNGDQMFDGSLKIVYGGEGASKKKHEDDEPPLTDEELKRKCDGVRSRIGNTDRLWFPVCRYIMWRKRVAEGDFDSAVAIIERLYPGLKLNADNIAENYAFSFTKTLDKWDPQNAPVRGTTYNKYYSIAELMKCL